MTTLRPSLPKLTAAAGLLWLSACGDPSGPARPAAVEPAAGSGQEAAAGAVLPEPLVVRVTDAIGRPVRGVAVTWTAGPGSGALTPLAAATDAEGRASAAWVLGTTAGAQSATAEVAEAGRVTFTATARPGAAATVSVVSGNTQTGTVGQPLPQELVVWVADAHGNPVPEVEVTWQPASGGGSAVPAAARTSAQGIASARWTLGTLAGAQTLLAAAPSAAPATFAADARFSETLRVLSPTPTGRFGDTLVVEVVAQSGEEIVSVTATAEGRTAALAPVSGRWRGTLSLAGVARGPRQVTVTARDAGGAVQTVTVPFLVDRRPVVTVTAPLPGTVARPSVRVTATCHDDDPGGCTTLQVEAVGNSVPAPVVAQGQNQVDATVTLPPGEIVLRFVGVDSAGRATAVTRAVFSEPSPRWIEVASAGTAVWQVSGDRILFVDSTAAGEVLKARDRATGAETVLFQRPGWTPRYGFLAPRGAVFVARPVGGSVLDDRVFDARDGALVELGAPNSAESLRVAGRWALWSEGSRLTRRDLLAGTNLLVSADAGNTENHVAENGDVVFWSNGSIFRWRGGTVTPLAGPDATVLANSYPVTDGVNVVYRQHLRSTGQLRLALFEAAGETVLAPPTSEFTWPRQSYQASGGWVAYLEPGPSGVRQVWLRSPTGAETQVTTAGVSSSLDVLGPNGELTFFTGSRRYAVLPGGAPVDIGHAWVSDPRRAFWLGGELYVALGRSVFRVQF